jgi:hypothetical protein
MWQKIQTTFETITAFFQDGKVPPNTPFEYKQDLSKINFFSSKKFFIVFSSVILLMLFYLSSVGILFLTSFFPSIIQPYVIIFSESIKIFAIIISVYLGLQATIDFKYHTESKIDQVPKSIEELDKQIVIEETIKYQKIYQDDITYAPLEWVMNFEEKNNE